MKDRNQKTMNQKTGIILLKVKPPISEESTQSKAIASSDYHMVNEKGAIAVIEYPFDAVERSKKDRTFELVLKDAANLAARKQATLIIDSNGYLESSKDEVLLEYLKIIEREKIDFKIKGLDHFNKESLSLFVNIMDQRYANAKALRDEMASQPGAAPSNRPTPEAGMKALKLSSSQMKSALRRKQAADLDPRNILARKEIVRLKKLGKQLGVRMTDYAISKKLTDKEIKTRNNNPFRANEISRQIKAFEDLEAGFKENNKLKRKVSSSITEVLSTNAEPEIAPKANSAKAPKPSIESVKTTVPISLKNRNLNVTESLVLSFRSELLTDVVLCIYDNKEELLHEVNIPSGTSEESYSIIEDIPLRPGLYYASLSEQSTNGANEEIRYKPVWFSLTVRKDVIAPLSDSDSKFSASDFQ